MSDVGPHENHGDDRYPWELDDDDDDLDDDSDESYEDDTRAMTAVAPNPPLGDIPAPPLGASFGGGQSHGVAGMKPAILWSVVGAISIVVLLIVFGLFRAFSSGGDRSVHNPTASALKNVEGSGYSAINSLAAEAMATPDVASSTPSPPPLSRNVQQPMSAVAQQPLSAGQSYSSSQVTGQGVPDIAGSAQAASQLAAPQISMQTPNPRALAAQQRRESEQSERSAQANADVFVGVGTSAGAPAAATADSGSGQAALQNSATPPPPNYLRVDAGTWIPVTLLSEVNLSIPGGVVAQVREPVFDSGTGSTVLIPRYAKVIGQFASGSTGGDRGDIIWTLLRYPDGTEIKLDSMHSQDARGTTGIGAHVDYHQWQIARTGLLSALAAVGTNLLVGRVSQPSTQIIISSQPSSGSVGDQAVQPIVSAANTIMQTDSSKPPTYTLSAGTRFNLFVDKALYLPPYGGGS